MGPGKLEDNFSLVTKVGQFDEGQASRYGPPSTASLNIPDCSSIHGPLLAGKVCKLTVSRTELAMVRGRRRAENDVLARTAWQGLLVGQVVFFLAKLMAASKLKFHYQKAASLFASFLGIAPLRNAVERLVPLTTRRPGQIVLDVAGHMSGPSFVLCVAIPIARDCLAKKVQEELQKAFTPAPPSGVRADVDAAGVYLRDALQKTPQTAAANLEYAKQTIDQAVADEVHNDYAENEEMVKAQVEKDIETLSRSLASLRKDGQSMLSGLRDYVFSQSSGGEEDSGAMGSSQ